MKRNMSIIPNSLTIGNMFFGFWSIIASINLEFKWACYCVIIGAICDALDGKVARLIHSTSDFGVEFDSLSDIITFGAAPSVLMFQIYSQVAKVQLPHFVVLNEFSHLFLTLSFLPLLFGGIRLARFNAELVGHDKEAFSGLPIPASALTIISFVLFEFGQYGDNLKDFKHIELISFTSLLVSYLMVSRIKYHGFPLFFKKKEKLSMRYLKLLTIIITIILIVKLKMSLLFPVMILFIFSGFVSSFLEKFKKDAESEDLEEIASNDQKENKKNSDKKNEK